MGGHLNFSYTSIQNLMRYKVFKKGKRNHRDAFLSEVLSFAKEFLRLGDVTIELKFDSKLPLDGLCISKGNHTFILKLNRKMNDENMLRTIFHELIHVSQIERGDYDPHLATWKGVEYEGYKETPWEKEAFELEEVMLNIFKPK